MSRQEDFVGSSTETGAYHGLFHGVDHVGGRANEWHQSVMSSLNSSMIYVHRGCQGFIANVNISIDQTWQTTTSSRSGCEYDQNSLFKNVIVLDIAVILLYFFFYCEMIFLQIGIIQPFCKLHQ